MFIFFYLFLIFCHESKLRFVSLPQDVQSVKNIKQTHEYVECIKHNFPNSYLYDLSWDDNYTIFMFMDREKVASFVRISKDVIYSMNQRKSFDFLTIYYFFVSEEYRGQKLSYRFMKKIFENLKEYYKLSDDTMIALHLSPNDNKMAIAAKVYYSLGFRNGMFIKSDPSEKKYLFDEVVRDSVNLRRIIEQENNSNSEGHFMFLYCFLKDFGKDCKDKITLEETQKLKKILENRRDKPQNNRKSYFL